ncbi:MAG TPA: peptide chain release factor 1 [Hyphomonadaceae bacterium]|jgi:peptide chain release factor 1|nr:peptide chain release factor 1 [Hyphomonadaceae bacterium]HPN06257.1 peptide chain release factor 1 [Hyphomonadaceae bacterium]
MAALPESRLRQMIDRFEQVEARMGVATDAKEIVQLSRDHAELKRVAEKAREVIMLRNQLAEADALIEDPSADRDFVNMAIEEKAEIKAKLPDVEREMQLMLLPKDRDDDGSAIIEVRAGTGGDEAALFAGDLWRQYQRYAQGRGWQVELVSATEGEMGGYKEVVAQLNGSGVFGRMKFESGVHRVQRVPATEAQGRIHTSAATVAILPVPEEVNIEVRDQDIRIDTYRSSGAGGQHVNKTDSAVRITHMPSGIVVTSSEKSQHENRRKAMEQLKIRLYEAERSAKDNARSEARKLQVGSGDRSERIRTYNFPQGRITDHRINLTLYSLDKFIEGDIDEMLNALIAEDQAERLAQLENG